MSTQEPFEKLVERIALAFEEQNRYNLEWIELQKAWHEEDEKWRELQKQVHAEAEALTEQRYQEQRAREQAWHDEAERLNEQRQQAFMHAYLASLKPQEENK